MPGQPLAVLLVDHPHRGGSQVVLHEVASQRVQGQVAQHYQVPHQVEGQPEGGAGIQPAGAGLVRHWEGLGPARKGGGDQDPPPGPRNSAAPGSLTPK